MKDTIVAFFGIFIFALPNGEEIQQYADQILAALGVLIYMFLRFRELFKGKKNDEKNTDTLSSDDIANIIIRILAETKENKGDNITDTSEPDTPTKDG